MAIAIRGGAPVVSATAGNPVTASLTGSQQPQTDDVLLIIHGNDFYDLTNMATPTVGGSSSGVTAVTNGAGDAGTNGAHAKAYTKVITSTGDVTVSVTETGSADEEKVLVVYVLSGVDTSTPADVASNGASAVSASTFVLPSVTTTPTDDMLFAFAVTQQVLTVGGSWSAGTSDFDSNFGGFISYVGMHQQLAASGATGTRTFDPVGSEAAAWAGVLVTLKTGTGGGAAAVEIGTPLQLLHPSLGPPGDFGRSWYLLQPGFAEPAASTNAPADVATATGTAPFDSAGGSISLNLIADNPVEAVGTAFDATVSTAPATNAPAGNAAGTGTANGATVKVSPSPSTATATGTANNATVQTGSFTNASAGLASATGTANNASVKVAPGSGIATATGVGQGATGAVSPGPAAASGAGAAQNTTSKVATGPTTATATGTVDNAVVNTGGNVNAAAGLASATGTANNATVTRSANAQAGVALAVGTVPLVSLRVLAVIQAAAALGVAFNAETPPPFVPRPPDGFVPRPSGGLVPRP